VNVHDRGEKGALKAQVRELKIELEKARGEIHLHSFLMHYRSFT